LIGSYFENNGLTTFFTNCNAFIFMSIIAVQKYTIKIQLKTFSGKSKSCVSDVNLAGNADNRRLPWAANFKQD